MREDAIEFCELFARARAPAKQQLKRADRVAAYNSDDMNRGARIDQCGEERRQWKAYLRTVRKYRASVSKEASSNDDNPCHGLSRLTK